VLTVATTNYNSVALTWTDNSLEDTFTLQKRATGDALWDDITTLGRNVVQYTVAGLNQLTSYEFRIKAEAVTISSSWSAIVTVVTPGMPPTTPALNVPVATVGSVALSWSNPSLETGIVVERSVSSPSAWMELITLPADSTAYTDTNVISLTNYYYRVKARNAAGDSAYSSVRNVTVPAPAPPPAPTGLSAKPLSSSTVLVTWNDVVGENGYRLERRTEASNSWVVVIALPVNTTSFADTNLVEGTQYWYRAQSFNGNGNSAYSNEDDAVPGNIVNLIEDDFDPSLDSTVWSAVSGGIATNGGQGFRGSQALHFGTAGLRSATTIPLNITAGGTIGFFFRAGNEVAHGNAFWNNSESGESVVLEYSKDNGQTWALLQTLNTLYPANSNLSRPLFTVQTRTTASRCPVASSEPSGLNAITAVSLSQGSSR
jgi:hypothetical protein